MLGLTPQSPLQCSICGTDKPGVIRHSSVIYVSEYTNTWDGSGNDLAFNRETYALGLALLPAEGERHVDWKSVLPGRAKTKNT